jgi:hypothetical protein
MLLDYIQPVHVPISTSNGDGSGEAILGTSTQKMDTYLIWSFFLQFGLDEVNFFKGWAWF